MTKTLYDPEVEKRGIQQGLEKGIEEGIEKGIEKGIKESILSFLSDLGEIPEVAYKKVDMQKDINTLKQWTKVAARVESIEEFLLKTK